MSPRRAAKGKPPRRGLFVVLEGLDGAGTTTQLHRLTAALAGEGQPVLATSEPSVGPVGALLRQALKGRAVLPGGEPLSHETLALLFAADRMDHLASEILPALAGGTHVLCDRYVLSSLAYQGAEASMEWVAALNQRARAPDLTLFLQVDVTTAARRRLARGGSPELYEADEHQQKIATQYLKAIAQRKATDRIAVIDGTRTPEAITREALELIHSDLERQ